MSLFEQRESKNNNIVLENDIILTDTTEKISNAFDYEFTGKTITEIVVPKFPDEFQIGLIVGASGSGKSTLLSKFGKEETIKWNNDYCIADNFDSYEDAMERLGAVGLNSIPAWLQSYNTLSNGQKFRADMARRLKDNAVIDEFTSVVNRECAISCSNSIQKYIRNKKLKNIVFCSCHYDIIEYLQPDWIYNTDTKELSVGRSVRQKPDIVLKVNKCCTEVWQFFRQHHYLSSDILKSADCYVITWNNKMVAFASVRPMPGKFIENKKAYMEHRFVVLPDYQGLGIGNKISEYFGDLYTRQGYLYYARTANPRMGIHRDNHSELWQACSGNHASNFAGNTDKNGNITETAKQHYRLKSEKLMAYITRVCYSHRYCANDDLILDKKSRKTLF